MNLRLLAPVLALLALAACPPPPTLPRGARACSGPADCVFPVETCGFAGWNQYASCIPNESGGLP